jgi:cold shock CspA family protein
MRVEMYAPEKLYGFAETEVDRVFFHLETFIGGTWPGIEASPPPLVGERVRVTFTPNPDSDKPPRASLVERVEAPVQVDGVVDSFNTTRGWGFIKGSDGVSYYLHRSEVPGGKLPLPNQEASFFVGFKRGRPRACYVRLGKLHG